MIPQSPSEIRAWIERLAITEALGAEALGLGNADTVMREYCSGRREPAQTTRLHMDLLEAAFVTFRLLQTGQVHRAKVFLEKALAARHLIDLAPYDIDTTPKEKTK